MHQLSIFFRSDNMAFMPITKNLFVRVWSYDAILSACGESVDESNGFQTRVEFFWRKQLLENSESFIAAQSDEEDGAENCDEDCVPNEAISIMIGKKTYLLKPFFTLSGKELSRLAAFEPILNHVDVWTKRFGRRLGGDDLIDQEGRTAFSDGRPGKLSCSCSLPVKQARKLYSGYAKLCGTNESHL